MRMCRYAAVTTSNINQSINQNLFSRYSGEASLRTAIICFICFTYYTLIRRPIGETESQWFKEACIVFNKVELS